MRWVRREKAKERIGGSVVPDNVVVHRQYSERIRLLLLQHSGERLLNGRRHLPEFWLRESGRKSRSGERLILFTQWHIQCSHQA